MLRWYIATASLRPSRYAIGAFSFRTHTEGVIVGGERPVVTPRPAGRIITLIMEEQTPEARVESTQNIYDEPPLCVYEHDLK